MGSRSLAGSFFAVCLAVAASGSAHAVDGFRCGGRLAQGGETLEVVRKKCGDPTNISMHTLTRQPSYHFYGTFYVAGSEYVTVPVEVWTYNFGPNKFMRRLRFVDGLLETVETLGYGYH